MPRFFPAAEQRAGTTRQLLREPDGSVVRRTVLPTGLRIVSESVPGVRATAIGVWAGVGSRDETTRSAGAAHFLEHLLFKGTRRRSAMQIAAEVDAVGGQMNAFTSKEYTCFYAKVLGADLPVAVDVLTDITTSATIATADVEAERSVVLEEIGLHEDDAADIAGETVESSVLDGSRLARPILGTRASITAMSRATVRGFHRRNYRPESLAVTASGNVDHHELVKLVRAATEHLAWAWGVAPDPLRIRSAGGMPEPRRGTLHLRRWQGEQCAVEWGVPGLARTHDDRRALEVLTTIAGGGMSARLFQEVRERRGLAYSIYANHQTYSDTGVWAVSAGCHGDNVEQLLQVVRTELGALAANGVGPEELARAKGQLAGTAVLAGEDPSARMVALGRAEVATGELIGIDELLTRIDAVTMEDVNRLAHEILPQAPHVAVVGVANTARNRGRLEQVIGG